VCWDIYGLGGLYTNMPEMNEHPQSMAVPSLFLDGEVETCSGPFNDQQKGEDVPSFQSKRSSFPLRENMDKWYCNIIDILIYIVI
jgi:hypothetical protein